MKKSLIFKFTIDSIARKKLRFFGEVFILFVCFFMLTVGVFMKEQSKYYRKSLENVLRYGIENTGILNIKYESGDVVRFFNEAYDSPYISSIGVFSIGGTDILPELSAIQQEYLQGLQGQNLMDNYIEMYYISPTLLNLCNLKLTDGEIVTDTEDKGEYWSGLYLGSAFKDIPVGTVYTYQGGDETAVYEVLGILEEGTAWISRSAMGTGYEGTTRGSDVLDYYVILVSNTAYDYSGMFSVNESSSFDEAREYLYETAEKYNIELNIGSLATEVEQSERASSNMQRLFFRIFFLMSITAVICIISFQIVSVISRTKEYGILYATGAGISDITGITVIEILLKLIIAIIASMGVSIRFIPYFFSEGDGSDEIIKQLLFENVYPTVFAVGFILTVTAVLVPLIYINRLSPVKLLTGEGYGE